MKKVLIICDLFPPAFGPRMGYLCKYIRQYGWEPTVLTEDVEDEHAFRFLKGYAPVHYVNFNTAPRGQARKRKWLLNFIKDFLYGYKDRQMVKEAKNILSSEKFDLILCSSFRTFPLSAAESISRKHKIPLIVDLRDIIEQYSGTEYISKSLPSWGGMEKIIVNRFTQKSLKTRNRVLRKANIVTTVSPWHREILRRFNPQVELIYNGYDPELFYPEQKHTRHFVITYTGRLLSTAMRDPGLFFEALSRLIREKEIYPTDCRVDWYVDDASWKIITGEAEKHNLLSYMNHKGYVAATKIPEILNESSVILLLTNLSSGSGPKGVMTTKFFESLAVEKPILCVRSDESYLAEAIKETHAGLAATDAEEVYTFLKNQYIFWKENGYTVAKVNKDAVMHYSRPHQAQQFASLFNQITDPSIINEALKNE